MTSSDIKAYIVELGETDHKPCWSIRISLLKVGFWEKLICVKAMEETLGLVSLWQAKSINQHWRQWGTGLSGAQNHCQKILMSYWHVERQDFLNGKTATKMFALFSFWVDVFILYFFHILYISKGPSDTDKEGTCHRLDISETQNRG